jgi:hypothetical protein
MISPIPIIEYFAKVEIDSIHIGNIELKIFIPSLSEIRYIDTKEAMSAQIYINDSKIILEFLKFLKQR